MDVTVESTVPFASLTRSAIRRFGPAQNNRPPIQKQRVPQKLPEQLPPAKRRAPPFPARPDPRVCRRLLDPDRLLHGLVAGVTRRDFEGGLDLALLLWPELDLDCPGRAGGDASDELVGADAPAGDLDPDVLGGFPSRVRDPDLVGRLLSLLDILGTADSDLADLGLVLSQRH